MQNFNDVFKNLQYASEQLSKLNLNPENPWESFNQMPDMFKPEFWEAFTHLTKAQVQEKNFAGESKTDAVQKSVPSTDIFQTLGKVIVSCEAPGLIRNSLKISIESENLLIIEGKIKEHDLSHYLIKKERFWGKFERQISLPSKVSSEGMKTVYKDGLLEIQLTRINRENV